jgi:heterodisulfide reductase subunit D
VIIISKINPKDKYKHLSKFGDTLLQCVSCGDCREATDFTANPPKWGVCAVRDHTSGFEPYFGRGKMQIIRSLWQGKLELSTDLAQVFFQCPTCNACAETCAYDMNNALLYEALRAELVDAGYDLEAHRMMNDSLMNHFNPYQRENDQKGAWIKGFGHKVKDVSREQAEILYFVGCTAALTPEIQTIAINTIEILTKLRVDFALFGEREVCCGSVALRTGNIKAFNAAVSQNYSLFKKSGIKTIITSCAGCYRTLKTDYADHLKDLDIQVLHSLDFIIERINDKAIRLKDLGITTTYHDPCHVGRNAAGNPLYDEPRRILSVISSLNEMKTIKENAKCCGAGGGVKKGFPDLALKVAISRVQEAEETGADYLVSICPFCYRNLSDAIKSSNSRLKMVDLIELINKAL